jgi:hypothetical protein
MFIDKELYDNLWNEYITNNWNLPGDPDYGRIPFDTLMKRKITGLKHKAEINEKQTIDNRNLKFIDTLLEQDKLKKKEFVKIFQETGYLDIEDLFKKYSNGMRRLGKTIQEEEPPPEKTVEDLEEKQLNQDGEIVHFRLKEKYPQGLKKIGGNISWTNSFPLKKNKKHYSLHHIAPKNTYIEDIVFFESGFKRKIAFLILINENTRQAHAIPLNIVVNNEGKEILISGEKSIESYIPALSRLIVKQGLKIKYLKADNEKAFGSTKKFNGIVSKFYKDKNITFIPAPVSFGSTNHTSLSLIDRLVRTIRDMMYNMNEEIMTPQLMNQILFQYNNAPHKTLSKYLKFSVTPNEMNNITESDMARKIKQENYNILRQPGFKFKENDFVLAYDPQDPLKKRRSQVKQKKLQIIGFENGLYVVRDEDGNVNHVSRYLLRNVY